MNFRPFRNTHKLIRYVNDHLLILRIQNCHNAMQPMLVSFVYARQLLRGRRNIALFLCFFASNSREVHRQLLLSTNDGIFDNYVHRFPCLMQFMRISKHFKFNTIWWRAHKSYFAFTCIRANLIRFDASYSHVWHESKRCGIIGLSSTTSLSTNLRFGCLSYSHFRWE